MTPDRRPPGPRRGARALLALAAAGTLALLTAAPVAAHVLIETVEPRGDGSARLTFTFDHGCDGEPTDGLRVTLPAGVEALGAGQPSGWTSEVTDDAVAWAGEPVPDGERAAFTLDVRVTGSPVRRSSSRRCRTARPGPRTRGRTPTRREPARHPRSSRRRRRSPRARRGGRVPDTDRSARRGGRARGGRRRRRGRGVVPPSRAG